MLGTIFADPSAAQELLNNAPGACWKRFGTSSPSFWTPSAPRRAGLPSQGPYGAHGAGRLAQIWRDAGRGHVGNRQADAERASQQTGPQARALPIPGRRGREHAGHYAGGREHAAEHRSQEHHAFTSEEIRATESWARKFYRELGTKSPFFRAWFGDWRANDTTPVTLPDIDENAQIASGRSVNADTKMQISWNRNFKNESAVHAIRQIARM